MKPRKNYDFNVQEVGNHFELSGTQFYGIVGGIEYLVTEGYEINYDGIRTMGGFYMIPTVGNDTKVNKKNLDNRFEINQVNMENDELKEKNKKLMVENRTIKAQMTKLKKKIEK